MRYGSTVLVASLVGGLLATGAAQAAIIPFDISPTNKAINLLNYSANRDHAQGLSALNETLQPASSATGNETGAGITYDDVTNQLTFNFAYGSAFGFVDLVGNYSAAHIHGNGAVNYPAVNTSAGVLFDLASFHTPSGTKSGSFTGSVTLSGAQETALLNNLYYINVHSSFAGGGEIRGQLVAVPEPSSALLGMLGAAGLFGWRRWRRRTPSAANAPEAAPPVAEVTEPAPTV